MRAFIVTLFCCCVIFLSAKGQHTSLPDSVRKLDATQQVEYLHNLVINTWLNYPKEAMNYANEALKLADSTGEQALIAQSVRLKGGVHYYLGNYDSVIFYTKKSLEIASSIQDTVLINNALNNLGLTYYNLGSYQNALEYLLRSLKYKEISGEIYGRAHTINNVGLVYNKLKDFERAREYFEEALEFSTIHNNLNLQLYSLNNIAGTYLAKGKIGQAKEFYQRADSIQVDNKNWKAVTYSGLGQVAIKEGKNKAADQYFKKALKLREEIGDKNGVSEIYYFYALEAQSRNHLDSALHFLDESQTIAKQIGSKDRMFANFELYAEIYTQLGNIQKAFEYQTALLRLRDTLFNENMARNLSDIQLKIQQEESNELLSQKEEQLVNSQRFTIFLIIIIVLTLVLLLVIYMAFRNNRRINKLLEKQNNEISEQKEEILQQKESLLHKNTALEGAQRVIKEQNEKLEIFNEQLLQTVDEQTKELEESNEQLKIANLELDNFIYKSSHDIKGPLATLMGVCNVALMDVKDDEAIKYLKMLAETAKGLNDILARLKTISDVNSLDLKIKKIDFNKIFDQCIKQVSNIEGKEEINVNYDIQDNIFYESDAFLIDLIVYNMIHNAVRFQTGGKNEFLKIKVEKENDKVIMHFIDNGISIDEEDSEDIFHLYSKSAMQHQSLGLGLYLVKQCVQKLGGEIMLINDNDLTHFRIVLPAY